MAQLSVAVVVATRNRPASLGRLIDGLLAQSRRPDEILIIDDGQLPDDRLADWQSRCQSAGVKWVYQRKDRPGRSASRNLAAGLTACDTVCFLDDDCEPAASCLERLLDGLAALGRWQMPSLPGPPNQPRPPIQPTSPNQPSAAFVAIEPMVIPPGGVRLGDRAFGALLRISGYWGLARVAGPKKLGDRIQARPVLGGVCLVYRDALAATQFDVSLSHSEDRDWSVRLSRLPALGRLGCATDAVCLHHVDPVGRPGAAAVGARIARNYISCQGKLFGWRGTALAFVTLTAMAAGELVLGLVGCATLRKAGPGYLAMALGTIGGMFSPTGRRADE